MKAQATENSSTKSVIRVNHAPTFSKVLDGRKQPIRGLWVRNGRYYAQLKVEEPITGIKKVKRVPLKDKDDQPVATVAQAVAAMAKLKTQRADNALPVLGQQPKFAKYVTDYLSVADLGKDGEHPKQQSTVAKEKTILARWAKSIGDLRLDQIKRVHVNRFIESRRREQNKSGSAKVSARTINLDVIALRVVLKKALEEGLIQRLPTEGLRPLKTVTRKRPLFDSAELDKICEAVFEAKQDKKGREVLVSENAQQFSDYIRLMAYCGARRNEALGLRWADVDTDNGQLTIGAEGNTKNRSARVVDFNPKLKAHLLAMKERRAPDSQWLFPSPQRGDKDIHAATFKESLRLARERAKMPSFNFHDCRHHFISMCVMSGIDFMTIAAWVGHKDGGVLIGKVYGHLANEHRKAMAEKVNFGPAVLVQAAG